MISFLNNLFKRANVDCWGITNKVDYSYLKNRFEVLRKNQNIAEFDEIDFEKRGDLSRNYPEVKTIISVAIPYLVAKNGENSEYTLSKYALGIDYHILLTSILERVRDGLRKRFKDNYFEIAVDMTPAFEKEIAVQAGVGFVAKNNLLYTEKYGSYIFLGEIFTNLYIPAKQKRVENRCMGCDLCKQSCPNDAISDNFIELKRCIAYLTVTKKRDFSPILLKNNLWGCDICQDVCPLNKDVALSPFEEFKKFLFDFKLVDIIFFSNRELKRKLKNSPIGWSGINVLKRNAIAIMGNSCDKAYIPFLERFLMESDNEWLKKYAKDAIKRLSECKNFQLP